MPVMLNVASHCPPCPASKTFFVNRAIVLSTPLIVRSSATPPATRFAYFRGLPPLPPLPPHENRVMGPRPLERPLMSKHLSDQQAALAGHRLATTGHRDFPGDQATRGPVLAAEPGAGHPALRQGGRTTPNSFPNLGSKPLLRQAPSAVHDFIVRISLWLDAGQRLGQ